MSSIPVRASVTQEIRMAAAAHPRMSLPPMDTVISPIWPGWCAMKRSAATAWVCPCVRFAVGPWSAQSAPVLLEDRRRGGAVAGEVPESEVVPLGLGHVDDLVGEAVRVPVCGRAGDRLVAGGIGVAHGHVVFDVPVPRRPGRAHPEQCAHHHAQHAEEDEGAPTLRPPARPGSHQLLCSVSTMSPLLPFPTGVLAAEPESPANLPVPPDRGIVPALLARLTVMPSA